MKLVAKFYQLAKVKLVEASLQQNEQRAIKSLRKFQSPYKLNVGSGTVKFEGWVNIDLERVTNITDVIWDATNKFSFLEDSSCSLIYNEHFLEHLDIQDGVSFLSECYRLLMPGGILRIAMPSLEYVITKYNSEDWKDQDWLTWPQYQFIKTKAEMINIAFRWWGHQWLYDREELHRRLHESGFNKIKDVEWRNSDVSELKNRETRLDSILLCEAEK